MTLFGGVLVLGTAALTWPVHVTAAAAIKFDGCYENVNESLGITYNVPTNLNADCAHFCAAAGYILAATKGETCHCTNNVMQDAKQTPYDVLKDGDVACDTVCAGAQHTADRDDDDNTVCVGDICCGSTRHNRYSVYAVGGIALLPLIEKRIRHAVNSNDMPWINDVITSSCSRVFFKQEMPHGINAQLALGGNRYTISSENSVERCKYACVRQGSDCLSIAYVKKTKQCYRYKSSIAASDLKPVQHHTVLYERQCNDSVRVQPTSFSVVMIKQDVIPMKAKGTDMKMLDDTSFELDLSNSNSWDKIERNFDSTVSESTSVSTDSGFETGSSTSNSQTSEQSEERNTERSTSNDRSSSRSHSVSVTASASVDAWVFSVKASVGGSFNTGSSESQSTDISGSSSSSSSTSRTYSQDTSNSRTFNSGYSRQGSTSKFSSMSFGMTVPAYHKGTMSFSKESAETVVKIRSTFQLNGYLKFLIKERGQSVPYEKEVHVSRVLQARDRVFATFTTLTMNRPTIKAKTSITNREGNKVSIEDVRAR